MVFNLEKYIIRYQNGEDVDGGFEWVDIYGATPNMRGKHSKEMRKNPEYASQWLGRVLMQIVCEDTDNPELCLKPINDPEVLEMASQQCQRKNYEIKAEVHQGLLLPDGRKFSVEIVIGDIILRTEETRNLTRGYNMWNHRFTESIYEAPYQTIEDFPDVFVYLLFEGVRVSYWRGKPTDFTETNAELKWVVMHIDKSIGEIEDPDKAGLVSFRLAIHDQAEGDIQWSCIPNWADNMADDPQFCIIRAHIFQCKELPPADSNGTSDPYIQIWGTDRDVIKKTNVVSDNNNPIFYENLDFKYPIIDGDIKTAPPIVIDVKDKDTGILAKDDNVGRALIHLQDASWQQGEKDGVPKPRWHSIKLEWKEEEPVMGQILCSFTVLRPEEEFYRSLDQVKLQPETMEYRIEINVLGLRNLQSVGILPVKKPFIQFNLKSLLPPDRSGVVDNIQTQPSDAGANPTLSTVIKFSISLPTNPLYCPSLTCGIYDYIFKGLYQPLIGSFVIDLGETMKKDYEIKIRTNNELDQIITSLQTMIDECGGLRRGIEADSEHLAHNASEIQIKINQKLEAEIGEIEVVMIPKEETFVALDDVDQDLTSFKIGNEDINEENPLIQEEHKQDEIEMVALVNHKQDLDNKLNEEQAKKKTTEIKREIIDEELAKSMGRFFGKNVIFPEYQYDGEQNIEVELEGPPPQRYMALGYNENPTDTRKHYRMYYEDELENVKTVMPDKPFTQLDILRGQSRGLKQKHGMESTNLKQVGMFKGIINVINKEEDEAEQASRSSKVDMLKIMIEELYQKIYDSPFDFNYDTLETFEGREAFKAKMVSLKCERLNITRQLA